MENMRIVYVEAVLMANDEVIHFGKSLGFIGKTQRARIDSGANKLTRGNEDVVALKVVGSPDNCA